VSGDADIAASGALLSDHSRVQMLAQLSDGRALPASELAAGAGVSRQTASVHLDKLRDAGWLEVEAQGRHRYYRLADRSLVDVLEALARISPSRPVRTLRGSIRGDALREARLCYDHLAGRLGTALTDALRHQHVLDLRDGEFTLTPAGTQRLEDLGLDIEELRRKRRSFARPCLDWSERRHHLAGALGAALATHCFTHGWLNRTDTRIVRITDAGREALRTAFALEL
jgi:DNA-binding transcriptional ArsR family regulator